jgi:RNA polymerase sigma-70 factor (ECF subfamily)
MGELTFTQVDRLDALDEGERALHMTEETFRVFYEQTANRLWAYLARMTGDDRLADDLLQESYYRFLRAKASFEGDDHRRNYLFRIATNLVRDHRRRPGGSSGHDSWPIEEPPDPAAGQTADRVVRRIDLARAMERLRPRERSLLWLAYAQGCSHEEIASSLGLKTGSLKALLFRARRRLLLMLAAPEGRR